MPTHDHLSSEASLLHSQPNGSSHSQGPLTLEASSYKVCKTSRSFVYSYYATPGRRHEGKTVLFLHGFPEYATMWAHPIKVLEDLGYFCIAPDLLGYGETSKPTDTDSYNSEGQSQDLAEILDAEDVKSAIVISHDWGAYLAGRFANWCPTRVLGLVLTSVPYGPAQQWDIDAIDAELGKVYGYEPFGYWKWFASPEAAEVLESRVESFSSLIFAEDSSLGQTDFTPTGKLEAWLKADKRAPQADYITAEEKSSLIRNWLRDGFAGKLGWYRAMAENAHWKHEQKLKDFTLSIPVLYIGGTHDAPTPGGPGDASTKKLCTDYRGVVLDSGHWIVREQSTEWLNAVLGWLGDKF